MFTSPTFLLNNAVNAELSIILVDILNSLLQYQMDGADVGGAVRVVAGRNNGLDGLHDAFGPSPPPRECAACVRDSAQQVALFGHGQL